MTRISLGTSASGPIGIDLDVLLRTRLLVQASSGGGKSWLLRRLTEQLFGKVQVIVIDPEGEFATLRERFGYVLVGKGGETPADRRSAVLVAHKLLELNASAVCDLYEMPPRDRHAWVRLFLEALIDAPKKLWHPMVMVVDEAHVFAPEKGTGESEASDAMIGFATRGRKRGFAPIFATQRLGKLSKNAAAELLNVLIGQTVIDVDRKRAADAMGILGRDQHEFFDGLRMLKPGQFWALGRAIATERTLVTVGPVTTTHPEAGSARHSAEPPPPPEKVRALLPKLADLPAEAEAKQRTEAELRQEIAGLKRELAAKPAPAAPAPPEIVRIEVPVLDQTTVDRLALVGDQCMALATGIEAAVRAARDRHHAAVTAVQPRTVRSQAPVSSARVSVPVAPRQSVARSTPASTNGHDTTLGNTGARRMLIALAQNPGGLTSPKLSLLTGIAKRGGTWRTYLGQLRGQGYVEGPGDNLRITDQGLVALGDYDPLPTGRELIDYWRGRLGDSGMRRIFDAVVEAWPRALEPIEVADAVGMGIGGGTWRTYLGKLRTLELIEGRGSLKASDTLFDGGT